MSSCINWRWWQRVGVGDKHCRVTGRPGVSWVWSSSSSLAPAVSSPPHELRSRRRKGQFPLFFSEPPTASMAYGREGSGRNSCTYASAFVRVARQTGCYIGLSHAIKVTNNAFPLFLPALLASTRRSAQSSPDEGAFVALRRTTLSRAGGVPSLPAYMYVYISGFPTCIDVYSRVFVPKCACFLSSGTQQTRKFYCV